MGGSTGAKNSSFVFDSRLLRTARVSTSGKVISQQHLANLANVSRRTIRTAESEGHVSMEKALRIAKALEIDLAKLKKRDDSPDYFNDIVNILKELDFDESQIDVTVSAIYLMQERIMEQIMGTVGVPSSKEAKSKIKLLLALTLPMILSRCMLSVHDEDEKYLAVLLLDAINSTAGSLTADFYCDLTLKKMIELIPPLSVSKE